VQHRWFVSVVSTLLLSCAGTAHVRETVARPRVASSEARRASSASSSARKATSARGGKPEASRDAKSAAELDEVSGADAFAGVDMAPPVEEEERPEREVAVKGIEGTMTRYDVRQTLESRDADFDRCHDQFRGGSGRIEFRIHVLANGDVGDVKVHTSKVRSQDLVDCYADVVSSSHFSPPHGGYADVKWTTKVGRSRRRPDAIFERPVRWDAPSVGVQSHDDSSETHRERRHRRRKGA
jgi:hypothetical protein